MKFNKKGFTLVELLAVIVVLGIIALIGFTSVGGIISDSKKSAAKQTVTNYVSAAKTACGVEMTKQNGTEVTTLTSDKISFDASGSTVTATGITFSDYCDKVSITSITVDGLKFKVDNGTISEVAS